MTPPTEPTDAEKALSAAKLAAYNYAYRIVAFLRALGVVMVVVIGSWIVLLAIMLALPLIGEVAR